MNLFEPFTTKTFTSICIHNDLWILGYIKSLQQLYSYKLSLYQSSNIKTLFTPESVIPYQPQAKTQNKQPPALLTIISNIKAAQKRLLDANKVKDSLLEAVNLLDELQGRDKFKESLLDTIYAFQKNYHVFTSGYLSFVFFGNPGTGKSTLASYVGSFFQKCLIMTRDVVINASRSTLVGSVLGQTAIKTRQALIDSLEGVIFIDEAYSLTPCQGTDQYGNESIDELVDFMSKFKCLHIVIVAGYKQLMTKCFFTNNEGLPRRFARKIELGNFTAPELVEILESMLTKHNLIKCTKEHNHMVCLPEIHKLLTAVVDYLYLIPDALSFQAGDIETLANIILGTALRCKDPEYIFASGNINTDKLVLREAVRLFLNDKRSVS